MQTRLAVEKARIKHAYGVTKEFVDSEKDKCEGFCPLCKRNRKLVVDHDHATGKYRGIICYSCNTALGMTNDSIELLIKLINYLEPGLIGLGDK